MKSFFILSFFFFISQLSIAHSFSGVISDAQGKVIPYATIFIKELNMGTTSNSEGAFKINLDKGEYNVQFRSIGFEQTTFKVLMDTLSIDKNIFLTEQTYQLHEIRVYKDKLDPAYPIIRRAISMAPYYLNQVEKYKAEVYLKGTAKLEKVPKLLQKHMNFEVDGSNMGVGDMIVGESFSEIEFDAPDVYHQKIISSNMSDLNNSGGTTFDMGLITESPYQPTIGDNVITPLAPQAFSYYKYRYEGYYEEGEYLVNKIKVTPKRKSKQLFSGYIYIVDGLWCLRGLELKLDEAFMDMQIDIQLAEVEKGVLLPISHAINIEGKIMGIVGSATYISSVKYRSFSKNNELKLPVLLEEYYDDKQVQAELEVQNQTKRSLKIDAIMAKDELSKADAIRLARLMKKEAKEAAPEKEKELELKDTYHVEKVDSVAQRDNAYWNLMRPNPLSVEESESYRKTDSLMLVKDAPADSTETPKKVKNKIVSKVIGAKHYDWRNDSIRIDVSGLIAPQFLSFNAVEGWKYRQEISYTQKFSGNEKLEYTAWLAYSFNRNEFQWNLQGEYHFAPLSRGVVRCSGGNNVVDYLGDRGVSPFVNAISSLFFKENYARYHQQRYFSFSTEFEPVNGFFVAGGVDYFNRTHLQNSTNFSFADSDQFYHPNGIGNPIGAVIDLTDDISAIVHLTMEYTPQSLYRIKNGVKSPAGSSWPTFSATYKKGVEGVFNSSSNWDYLELGIKQKIELGIDNEINYEVKAGRFLNNESVAFADYVGFRVSSIPVEVKASVFDFKLLPFYVYHNNDQFVTIGLNYKTPNLCLKYLPWISNQKWKENLFFNYLSTPVFRNYVEVGYSLSNLPLNSEVGVYCSFEDGAYRQTGIRTCIRF